jgi:L-cysteine desulfidase
VEAFKKECMVDLMNKEMVVALGCTDPVSISYASAMARKYLPEDEITKITVTLSISVIKSAMSVIIPGTSVCGVPMAAVLGALYGDADKKLEVLKGINDSHVLRAKELIDNGVCVVKEAKHSTLLYVEVEIETCSGDKAKVVIEDDYLNVVYIELNDNVIFSCGKKDEFCEIKCNEQTYDIDLIWEFINIADVDSELWHVKESIELNERIALEGLEKPYGLKVGRTMMDNIENGILDKSLTNIAISWTAAGADARMAGAPMPVMSNSGSGNQGITATMPVVAVANALGADEEKKIRAVALSNLATIYIKQFFGRISVICGVTVAAAGASCGIAYLLGGELRQVKSAIQNMMGNVTGMLCDGAKVGCALKVSTCVQAAVQAALLAVNGIEIKDTDGIIGGCVKETLKNLGKLSEDSSSVLNKTIVDIMINKAN